jgi:aspartyl-tRNA(Asn)/glutamyl-tRNA(Gln) amidotransferase subunit A
MTSPFESSSAASIARAVHSGETTAMAMVEASLARVGALNPRLNGFTAIVADRARAKASAIDARRQRGEALGPLAGAPFAVKNLFDVAGLPTLAGSKINASHAPAAADATLIERLEAAGAILVGALNMGEYAYDFTGENQHYGASRNPHAPDHMSGGSSGGSGTVVAAGMVPLSLGSDTNGSIRVPSSFCGLFGLKPTYGRLSRAKTFPFVSSFDHLGPLARSVEDLALSFDAMQGPDPLDHAQARRPAEPALPSLEEGIAGLRIARAGGYFASGGQPEAYAAVDTVASALGASRVVELPEARRARAAAYLITMAEGAALHLDRIRAQAGDFDLDVRDRLIAGAMIPAGWVVRAQKFRAWYRDAVARVFEDVDIILAPSTPCRAPRIGQKNMVLDGVEMAVRANLGVYTQPISFIGLPVVGAPVWTSGEALPIGVQIIAAPWREDLALRVARWLESRGVCVSPTARC